MKHLHVGLQGELKAELEEIFGRLKVADPPVLEEGVATCSPQVAPAKTSCC